VAGGAQSGRRGWRYRSNVAVRVLTGSLGAYAVAALLATALARTLPMARVEAVTVATLLAFVVAPAVTIWAFLAPGPWRAIAGVVVVALPLVAIAWMAGSPV
jgi:hypothetical protein